MVRIRFRNRDEEARGFYLLFTHGTVRGLPGGVYEVAEYLLNTLAAENIPYDRLPNTDTPDEAHALRNPAAAGLQ